MLFQRDKKRECLDKQEKSKTDPTAIGNLLLSSGHITKEQLEKALEFQKDQEDYMLGEILVRLGFISEIDFEYMIAKQRTIRNGFKTKEMISYLHIAEKRANSVKEAHENLHKVAAELSLKLNKE